MVNERPQLRSLDLFLMIARPRFRTNSPEAVIDLAPGKTQTAVRLRLWESVASPPPIARAPVWISRAGALSAGFVSQRDAVGGSFRSVYPWLRFDSTMLKSRFSSVYPSGAGPRSRLPYRTVPYCTHRSLVDCSPAEAACSMSVRLPARPAHRTSTQQTTLRRAAIGARH